MFAAQTRDLSHIELERSDNISSLSIAKAYRVNEVDISTERKTRARIRGENPSILALSVCVGVPRSEIWLWFVPCRGWRPRHPVNQRIVPNVIRASGMASSLCLYGIRQDSIAALKMTAVGMESTVGCIIIVSH